VQLIPWQPYQSGRGWHFYLALVVPRLAQKTPEAPAALVLSGIGARAVHADSALPLSVQPGELLFAQGSVSVGSSALTLIGCGEKLQRTFATEARLTFESGRVRS
jgi:hypothetical protein